MTSRRSTPNGLPADLVDNAKATAAMLERIRAKLSQLAGRHIPLILSSGYRCILLNRAVGSSDTSDHVRAMAADLVAPAFGAPVEICERLAPLVSELGIGQLINEFPDRSGWVHTSTRTPAKAVNRIITITGRSTVPGMVRF